MDGCITEAPKALGPLSEQVSVHHVDRGYDLEATRRNPNARGPFHAISVKGKQSAPLWTGKRWIVERTNSWDNVHMKLVQCTERRERIIDFPTPTMP